MSFHVGFICFSDVGYLVVWGIFKTRRNSLVYYISSKEFLRSVKFIQNGYYRKKYAVFVCYTM